MPKLEELQYPYHWQRAETEGRLRQKIYKPEDEGKRDFVNKIKGVQTFSDPHFFKTVFVSGDDMVAEEKQLKQKEIELWAKKVVVANKHFVVNTKPNETHQLDKF